MTKRQFFDALSERLRALPKEELNRTITYYNEIIEDYIEDGMSEAQAVAQLEPVDVIASRILHEEQDGVVAEQLTKQRKKAPVWLVVVLAVVGFPIWFSLLMVGISIVFSVLATLFSIMIALMCIPVGLAGVTVGGICLSPVFLATGNVPKGLVLLGGGLVCAALTLLAIWAVYYLVKGLWHLIRWIVRKITGLFSKRKAVA